MRERRRAAHDPSLSFCVTTSDLRRLLKVAAAQPNLQTLRTTPSQSGCQGRPSHKVACT
jgi:hypothetical protein